MNWFQLNVRIQGSDKYIFLIGNTCDISVSIFDLIRLNPNLWGSCRLVNQYLKSIFFNFRTYLIKYFLLKSIRDSMFQKTIIEGTYPLVQHQYVHLLEPNS